MQADRFGNPIDPKVGYARGSLLRGSADEVRRLVQAGRLGADFIARQGADKVAICTGNLRRYQITADDLATHCEEWLGPGVFGEQLRQVAIEHLGGQGHELVAAVNRTSAGIIATVLALCDGQDVISLVPRGDRSHASVARGASLAGVAVHEVYDIDGLTECLEVCQPRLLVVTTVTSELAMLDDAVVHQAVALAHKANCKVFLDEAYGARFRPVLFNGAKSLAYGADLVITNADKAGLSGPRAGLLCGTAKALIPVQAKASELGMEARAPIAVGVMRSLQGFTPELLLQEVADGKQLSQALIDKWGAEIIQASPLGPKIDEQDAMQLVLNLAGISHCQWVPAEITAVIGMQMLAHKGIVTVNTHGQPGGRVSIRLKPTSGALANAGGAQAMTECLYEAMQQTAQHINERDWFSRWLFGEA